MQNREDSDFPIGYMVRLKIMFAVKGISRGNAIYLFDGGKESTFGNLTVSSPNAKP